MDEHPAAFSFRIRSRSASAAPAILPGPEAPASGRIEALRRAVAASGSWSDRLALFVVCAETLEWDLASATVIEGLEQDLRAGEPQADHARYLVLRYALLAPLGAETLDKLTGHIRRAAGFDEQLLAMADEAAGDLASACRRYGDLADRHPSLTEARLGLARVVSRMAARERQAILHPRPTGARRIFDVFPFFNEFTLLDLKLAEMAPWVDRFVLVESATTFTGAPKLLHFAEASARYADFADRIVHVVADGPPDHVASTWAREFHQREQGLRGLAGACDPGDLVIISDVDEIVRREVVDSFHGQGARLGLETYRYFLNLREKAEGVQGLTSVWRADRVAAFGLSDLRCSIPYAATADQIAGAGWHFTSVASAEAIALKMRSYSHQEHSHKTEATFRKRLSRLREGDIGEGYEVVKLDALPPAVRRAELEAYLL